jgi:hypothetical protein
LRSFLIRMRFPRDAGSDDSRSDRTHREEPC